ncbi:MAG: hypothetical protein OEY57_13665 [Nitrospirota bacterium]|nr:hypothetical protein [Nitrospirota bacterium]
MNTSQSLVEYYAEGSVNWSSGSLLAKGIGIPPSSSVSASASTAMAGRAAKTVALRNLLELVQGIRVDSSTTVENYVVQSDEIQSRVQGLVTNAREIKRDLFPDGSVEVTLSMELWGEHALLSSLSPSHNSHPSSEPDHLGGGPNSLVYSGVILDARGLALLPVAFPSVLDSTRRPILSSSETNHLKRASRGGAQYFTLKDSQQLSSIWGIHPVVDKKESDLSMKRIGPRPLTIKGLDKVGSFQGDIIVSASDAKKIREDENLLNVLREGRIIIVTDPLIAGIEGRLPGVPTLLANVIDLSTIQ